MAGRRHRELVELSETDAEIASLASSELQLTPDVQPREWIQVREWVLPRQEPLQPANDVQPVSDDELDRLAQDAGF